VWLVHDAVVWLAVLLCQPDTFPLKCDLLVMKTDRLMLAIILVAVSSLVVKVTHSLAIVLHV